MAMFSSSSGGPGVTKNPFQKGGFGMNPDTKFDAPDLQYDKEKYLRDNPFIDEALAEQRKLIDDLTSQLGDYGRGQRTRINQDFIDRGDSINANLISRGLGSSSLLQSTGAALENERQMSLLDLEDSLLNRRQTLQMTGVKGLQDIMLSAHQDYYRNEFARANAAAGVASANIGADASRDTARTGAAASEYASYLNFLMSSLKPR